MNDEEIKNANKKRRLRDSILSFVFALILILIVVLIHGCNNGNNQNAGNETTNTGDAGTDLRLEIENDTNYKTDNPILVGIYDYKDKNTKRKLLSNYSSKWEYHNDINVFEVYYTHEYEISGAKQKTIFDSYRNKYDNADKYKIGYQVSFSVGDKIIKKTILTPKDTESFYDYIEAYLYDDYHQTDGKWYSHVTEEQYCDTTLLTSIKLTAGKKVSEVTSDISLTAFTYDDDDFNEDGTYQGTSKYTITVINEK